MTIDPNDLRAAVSRGLITEEQAASMAALAETRRSAQAATSPVEEPFMLFKGFNEIFIVVGLTILFGGWAALTAVIGWNFDGQAGAKTVLLALITLAALAVLSNYFTLKRRMIAPSIALSVMSALTAGTLGWALATSFGVDSVLNSGALAWATVGVVMLVHYRTFRVPFDAALIACAAFTTLWSLLAASNLVPDEGMALLRFSGHGSLAWLSVAFGLATFALAMRFDMSDPHRVSTRSTTGFWLHVVSAPLIVNTIALNLLDTGAAGSQLLLLAFLLIIACVAIVIDRRSFLVSGAAYAVALAFTLFDGSSLVIVFLGLGLVLLGAQWERLRSRLMRTLPDFPGKNNLPPYGAAQ